MIQVFEADLPIEDWSDRANALAAEILKQAWNHQPIGTYKGEPYLEIGEDGFACLMWADREIYALMGVCLEDALECLRDAIGGE